MNTPSFTLIEDQLRAFLGRTCVTLMAHEPNGFERFVHPHFRRRVASLDRLQLQDYCHVLLCNYRRDREHSCGVLFERHVVELGIDRDLRYCKELRHRYAHLEGMGEPVASKEQLSDLVIVERLVRGLLADRQIADRDHELIADIHREISQRVERVGEVVSPEKFDRDQGAGLSGSEKAELVVRIADAVAQRSADVVQVRREEPQLLEGGDGLSLQLTEIRATLERMSRELVLLGPARDAASEIRSSLVRLTEMLTVRGDTGGYAEDFAIQSDELLGDVPDNDELNWMRQTRAFVAPRRPLSNEEARERLITLRRKIWEETDSGPTADGLLRKSMIDAFLYHRPTSFEELDAGALAELAAAAPIEQQAYLPDIFAVLQRLAG